MRINEPRIFPRTLEVICIVVVYRRRRVGERQKFQKWSTKTQPLRIPQGVNSQGTVQPS
ncbi:Uu.00g128300.m01.CDS01 [Anthostomella pinea]|uniref:Uu.00g128300.m01.CDS01 n=1 Tax=Anthostomella pinea TaxID=933095 RepID=A0AAI8VIW5_9PEZI|nr:Uu.00g128300.m01.CDS01 [Anthostomella pinea]